MSVAYYLTSVVVLCSVLPGVFMSKDTTNHETEVLANNSVLSGVFMSNKTSNHETEVIANNTESEKKSRIEEFFVSKNPDDVRFYYYGNPNDEDERHEIVLNDIMTLIKSGFVYQRPLIMLAHGVLSCSLTLTDVQQVKNAYLFEKTDANLIMVDYGALTMSRLPYIFSPLSFIPFLFGHANTNIASERVTEFLSFLLNTTFVRSPQDIHLVGFSLGAHIFGNVGRLIYANTGIKINRITGLDPSPQYPGYPIIQPSDAEFVDVSLTSLGFLTNFKREGQVQFFINGGGPHQPNCPNLAPVTETFCSHTTAVFYFAKTIRRRNIFGCRCSPLTCKFPPFDCSDNITYGEHMPHTAQGDYYLSLS